MQSVNIMAQLHYVSNHVLHTIGITKFTRTFSRMKNAPVQCIEKWFIPIMNMTWPITSDLVIVPSTSLMTTFARDGHRNRVHSTRLLPVKAHSNITTNVHLCEFFCLVQVFIYLEVGYTLHILIC